MIASDSFKGTLTSEEVASVISGVLSSEDVDVETVVIADGGEGMVAAMGQRLKLETVAVETVNPLGKPLTAYYSIAGSTALLEVAAACGLPLLEPDERNPMTADTRGLGIMMRDALDRGVNEMIIGLGGSATVDGGLGMMQALGVRFIDCNGKDVLTGGRGLSSIDQIDLSGLDNRLIHTDIKLACDVDSPLAGPRGAAVVFGPQKGATEDVVKILDCGLKHYAEVLHRCSGVNVLSMRGIGAAGGIAAPLVALCGARLYCGIDLILRMLRFDDIIKNGVSLVVTGEGRYDHQSVLGKVVAGVAHAAGGWGVPVVVFTGDATDCPDVDGVVAVVDINAGFDCDGDALDSGVARERLHIAASKFFNNFVFKN